MQLCFLDEEKRDWEIRDVNYWLIKLQWVAAKLLSHSSLQHPLTHFKVKDQLIYLWKTGHGVSQAWVITNLWQQMQLPCKSAISVNCVNSKCSKIYRQHSEIQQQVLTTAAANIFIRQLFFWFIDYVLKHTHTCSQSPRWRSGIECSKRLYFSFWFRFWQKQLIN